MTRKRVISVLICLVFLLTSLLAGCGGQSKTGQDKTTGGDTGSEEVFNPSGYPIVNKPMTFKVFLPGSEMDFNEKSAWYEISEKTNVYIEWDNPTWNAIAERKQLMFASGDYADAIGGWTLSSADVAKYGPAGVFLPLQDWIEQYTVNIKQSFIDVPEAKATLTLPDGNIYTLPIIGRQPPTRACTHINKVWLERIGKDIPTTTDELLEVLKLFKTSDPNQNGEADEIPITFTYKGTNNNDHYGLFGWFGYMDWSNHMIQLDRKVVWAPAQEGWKDAVKYFALLWKEGVLDKEIFSHDIPQYDAKIRQDPPIVGIYQAFGNINLEVWTYLPPPKTPNGNKPAWPNGDPWIFKEQCAITVAATKDGKDPRALLRYVDEIYLNGTYDGSGLNPLFHGPKGVGWDLDEEGKIITLDPSQTDPEWEKKFGMPYGFAWYEPLKTWENKAMDEAAKLKNFVSGEIWGPYQGQQLPQLWLSEEQQAEASSYLTDLQKLTEEMTARWISNQGDIDAEYEQYLNECKKMGLDNLLKIYQDAVDAYYRAAK